MTGQQLDPAAQHLVFFEGADIFAAFSRSSRNTVGFIALASVAH